MAAAVGSDVPFFLWPGPQLAMGRGRCSRRSSCRAMNLVIAMPDLGLSTAAVYGWRDEDTEVASRTSCPGRAASPAARRTARPVADVAALVDNDLEASVTARKPAVRSLRDRLRGAGALAAAMTGSGAAVFGLFADAERASAARRGAGAHPRLGRSATSSRWPAAARASAAARRPAGPQPRAVRRAAGAAVIQ